MVVGVAHCLGHPSFLRCRPVWVYLYPELDPEWLESPFVLSVFMTCFLGLKGCHWRGPQALSLHLLRDAFCPVADAFCPVPLLCACQEAP